MQYDSETKTVRGCWLEISANGMRHLTEEGGQIVGREISPRQLSAWLAEDSPFDASDWSEVGDHLPESKSRYWPTLMRSWNMDPAKVYQDFDASIPVSWFGGVRSFREWETGRRVGNARADMRNPSLAWGGTSNSTRRNVIADMHGVSAGDL